MSEINNHNSSCAFAEQTISYLYGEIPAQEKTGIEAHLNSCATCAEEFAGFKSVRSSVIEWRNEEFALLELPAIEIPYDKTPELFQPRSDSKLSGVWLNRIRGIFSVSPAFGFSAALAVIAVCLGIVFFVNKPSKNDDFAVSQKDVAVQANSDNARNKVFQDDSKNEILPTAGNEQAKSPAAGVQIRERKAISALNASGKNLVVKVSDVSKTSVKIANREANSTKMKNSDVENKRLIFAQNGKLPRLNNVEEEEDKSLRLAELLNDDGAK